MTISTMQRKKEKVNKRSNPQRKLMKFIESLTLANGPYPYINGTELVADAYKILREVRSKK